eukprot:6196939-Pleurochrysis_carterae.AAC.1
MNIEVRIGFYNVATNASNSHACPPFCCVCSLFFPQAPYTTFFRFSLSLFYPTELQNSCSCAATRFCTTFTRGAARVAQGNDELQRLYGITFPDKKEFQVPPHPHAALSRNLLFETLLTAKGMLLHLHCMFTSAYCFQ